LIRKHSAGIGRCLDEFSSLSRKGRGKNCVMEI
jgi:hypothetical protein